MKPEVITNEITQILVLSVAAFILSMMLTPVYTFLAYRYKFWKKQREESTTGEKLKVFLRLHSAKFKRNIPTMAGAIGVISIAAVTFSSNFDRGQTLLPLAGLLGGAVVGLIDDIINLRSDGHGVAGLRSSVKFLMISVIGLVLGWYFFAKLGYSSVHIPFLGDLALGWMMVPLFGFAVVATGNAVNISDGLDGLAGGLLSISFGSFGIIALLQGHLGLAAFCVTVVGVVLS